MDDGQLYEKFMCAPGLRLEAHERVAAVHHENLIQRIEKMEELVIRVEKRMWLTIYGVVGVILAEAVQSFLVVTP